MVGRPNGFANRFGFGGVVLIALDVRLHVLRRHQPHLVPKRAELASPVVRLGGRPGGRREPGSSRARLQVGTPRRGAAREPRDARRASRPSRPIWEEPLPRWRCHEHPFARSSRTISSIRRRSLRLRRNAFWLLTEQPSLPK